MRVLADGRKGGGRILIQTESVYGLNDTKLIKKKQVTLILYLLTPSDINFQTVLMPKVILIKKIVTKSLFTWTILI